ncbi:MAG: four helix bundle protein [Bacteroidales bacterium]|nr:four helix bundle protein [Bacteroidales bacterium]
MAIQNIKDLKVYNAAFNTAMDIFHLTRNFPDEEKYSLTSQMVRSSRSIAANIREGYAKRSYEQVFIRHLIDSLGSSEETRTWLDFAIKCDYISNDIHQTLDNKYEEIGAMLYTLQKNWKKY